MGTQVLSTLQGAKYTTVNKIPFFKKLVRRKEQTKNTWKIKMYHV